MSQGHAGAVVRTQCEPHIKHEHPVAAQKQPVAAGARFHNALKLNPGEGSAANRGNALVSKGRHAGIVDTRRRHRDRVHLRDVAGCWRSLRGRAHHDQTVVPNRFHGGRSDGAGRSQRHATRSHCADRHTRRNPGTLSLQASLLAPIVPAVAWRGRGGSLRATHAAHARLETAARVRTLALVEIVFAQLISRRLFSQRTTRLEWLGMTGLRLGVILVLQR